MIALALACLLLYGAAVFGLAYVYVRPRGPVPACPPGFFDEVLQLESGAVPVWLTEGLARAEPKSGTVLILVHGYRGDRSSWKEAALDLRNHGFEIAIPALPGHEANPDPVCGFTVKERRIVAELAAWARSRFAQPPRVVLVGISMGGASCWLASEIDPAVDAVITEGALVRVRETTDRWLDRALPLGRHLLRPVRWIAERLAKVDSRQIDVLGAAARWRGRPALVIQGGLDRLIPMRDAEDLARAAGCPLWVVPEARHAHGYRQARRAYLGKVLEVVSGIQGSETP